MSPTDIIQFALLAVGFVLLIRVYKYLQMLFNMVAGLAEAWRGFLELRESEDDQPPAA